MPGEFIVYQGPVTVKWDANEEPDLAGYRIQARVDEWVHWDVEAPITERTFNSWYESFVGRDMKLVLLAYDFAGNFSLPSDTLIIKFRGPKENQDG